MTLTLNGIRRRRALCKLLDHKWLYHSGGKTCGRCGAKEMWWS